MIFVEPSTAHEQRIRWVTPPARRSDRQQRSRIYLRSHGDDFWVTLIFGVLRDCGDEAMPFTALVNQVVRQGNYSERDDREARKIELFRLVGRLIRLGHLDRCERKYVTLPKSNARRQALLATVPNIADLPPPEL